MVTLALRRSFVLFHVSLALVVFVQSVRTIVGALHHHATGPLGSHLIILAGIEAIAALLFLYPKTLKMGGVLLLLIFVFAIAAHGIQDEFELIVYAAGVIFVTVHGSAYSKDLIHIRKVAS